MTPAQLLAASVIVGLWPFPASAADLRPEDAVRHIGETATVCGVVASAVFEANVQDQPTLLDLGELSPHAVFTAVIYGDNRPKFGTSETSLRGKQLDGVSEHDLRLPAVIADLSRHANALPKPLA